MSADLRLPNITATTPEGQTKQLTSYLYQLVNQLSWIFDNIDVPTAAVQTGSDFSNPKQVFASIKQLIMKSTDVSKAVLENISPELLLTYLTIEAFNKYKDEVKVTREEIVSGGFTWQKITTANTVELWGMSTSATHTADVSETIALPVSMNIKGITAQASSATPTSLSLLGYTNSTVSIQFSTDCDASIIIHAVGTTGG